jgi:hypothetical protein
MSVLPFAVPGGLGWYLKLNISWESPRNNVEINPKIGRSGICR